jgi:hypothetical protein
MGGVIKCEPSIVGKIALMAGSYRVQLQHEKAITSKALDPDLIFKNETPQWKEKYDEAGGLLYDYNLKLKDIINIQEQSKKNTYLWVLIRYSQIRSPQ